MADTKISALTADTSPTSDDVTVTVDITSGTNKKVTLANAITKAHGLSDGPVRVSSGVMSTAIAGSPRTATKTVCAYNAVDHVNCDYICDGTGDQVEIQSAIDAVTTLGGTVKLSDGTFTVGAAINMKSNVNLEGQGRGTKVTRAANNYSILVASQTTVFPEISHILFDGLTKNVIMFNFNTNDLTDSKIHDCWFINGGYILSGGTNVYRINFYNNYVEYGDSGAGDYIAIETTGDASIKNNFFKQIGAGNVEAWRVTYAVESRMNVDLIGNRVYSLGDTWNFIFTNGETVNIVGNHFFGGRNGLYISAMNNSGTISGNTFFNQNRNAIDFASCNNGSFSITGNSINSSGQSADNTYYGISIVGSSNFTVTGNSIFGKSSANQIKSGIFVDATSQSAIVTGNSIINAKTSAITNNSTKSIVKDNQGGSSVEDTNIKWMKNTSGGTIAAGALVVLKSVAAGNEITVSTTAGDPNLYGMNIASLTDTSWGYVQTLGKTTLLKVNGTAAIGIGDWITQKAGTAGIGVKAVTGNTVIAKALEAYSGADDNGVIDAILVSPRTI